VKKKLLFALSFGGGFGTDVRLKGGTAANVEYPLAHPRFSGVRDVHKEQTVQLAGQGRSQTQKRRGG